MTIRHELRPVAPGARVALIATSGRPSPEGIDRAHRLLSGWGLVPVEGPHLRDRHPRAGYLAGADADRAADLTWAWTDPDIQAVLCLRGGYGSVRMLDHLDATVFRGTPPKPLFGSSDVTGLHEWLARHVGVASWFAPMLGADSPDPSAMAGLRSALTGEGAEASQADGADRRLVTTPAARTLVPGIAEGIVLGGNLSLLAMTVGALPDRDFPAHSAAATDSGWIAALEDIAEQPYRLDGLLIRLLRSGWFSGARGVALGSWKGCGDLGAVEALMREYFEPLGMPVAWELGFGHGPGAATFPLNVPGRLVCEPGSARLEFDLSQPDAPPAIPREGR